MSWSYITLEQAGVFLWHTSAAQEWDFIDYGDMIAEIKNDTFYAFIRDGKCEALVRLKWIIQPYSGYFWIWVREDLRRPTRLTQGTTELERICHDLYLLMKTKVKVKRLMALCVSKSVAKLCQRFQGELKCRLEDLFHKGGHAYVIYWNFD